MRDDVFSRHIREARGLDPDWRAFKFEATDKWKVRITGAIARPATRHDPRGEGEPVWIKPLVGRVQMTLSDEQYRRLAEQSRIEREALHD